MFSRMKFRHKILIMPAIAAIGFVAVLVASLWAGARTRDVFTEVGKGYVPALELYLQLNHDLERLQRALQDAVAAGDEDLLAAADQPLAACTRRLEEAGRLPTVDAGSLEKLRADFAAYSTIARNTSRRMIRGEMGDEVVRSLQTMQGQYNELREKLDQSTRWARSEMVTSFERAESIRRNATRLTAVVTLLFLGILIGISGFVIRFVSTLLGRVIDVFSRMAGGDLTLEIEVTHDDEIGDAGRSINRLFRTLREVMQTTGDNAIALASASEELTSLSQDMSSNAEETSVQATVASASAEQVNANIQTVAIAVEELTASVKEIATSANRAAEIAGSAVSGAEVANTTITTLGASSAEIGKVINVINSIAEQTNLLALNATIEAARAGEAGKGFAVVANEVKELARETSAATGDIRNRIEAIQADSRRAVEAISSISAIIQDINDIQATIAAAVDEQTATTAEIGRNISEAAQGSSEIAASISGVAQAAEGTSHGAASTLAAAAELAKVASELRRTLSQFRYQTER